MAEDEIGDMREALGRIDGKLDMLLESKLDDRVRSLERSRSWLTGLSACAGGIAAAVVSFVSTHWSVKL